MKTRYGLLLLLISCSVFAQYAVDSFPSTSAQSIPPDKAFIFSAAARDYQTILARWQIAPGYQLYRSRIHFHIIKPKGAQLARPLLPSGINKISPAIGAYQVYEGTVIIPVPVISPQKGKITFEASYQGCSKAGYCYPPTMKMVPVDLSKDYMHFKKGLTIDVPISHSSANTIKPMSTKLDTVQRLLKNGDLWALILGFLGFGVLIAFTPCVLPMIPILFSIITGQKKLTTAHSFLLSLSYVLGMAITYAIAGILAALLGGSIQTALQVPWVIILFSLLLIAMALSLFGFYDIQLPQHWRSKLAKASEHQQRGTYFGVFIMGILSSLILSPCATPALVGILSYIGRTGNVALGGFALFVTAIGMGLPLLFIGFSHGKWIPTSGPWMNGIKNWMGILLLAMTIWTLQRILTGAPIMLMWGALAIGTSIYMDALSTVTTKWGMLHKAFGIIVFIYGILVLIGAATGHYDPLRPLQFTQGAAAQKYELIFKPVRTVADVKKAVGAASAQGKPVILDFWAQWCPDCKELDALIFANTTVQTHLTHYVLLRADVTRNNAQDKALERHFNIIAPPTILFFRDGKEISKARIIGKIGPQDFINHLKQVNRFIS